VKPVAEFGESSAKEEPKPETNGGEAVAPQEPTTPAKPAAPAAAETITPSSSTKPAASPATTEKKKKNRLSAMFSKFKGKVGGKDKP